MADTGFDRFMFGMLATIAVLIGGAAAFGLLVGAYALFKAGLVWLVGAGAALYAVIRWAWLPIYHKIEEEF